MQLETQNAGIEDAILVAGWQPHVYPEPVKEFEWSEIDNR
jgi:hypothetical protein